MLRRTRGTERALAAAILLLLSPLLLLIAAAIWISDPGPVLYLPERAGIKGTIFRMFKFRTMRTSADPGSRITGVRDARVFPFGALLRRLKLDELPQLLNIVRGEMAFVGPRPEDPWFVEHAYTPRHRETLDVPPGLTSPGSLYYYKHADRFIDDLNAEQSYIDGPMQTKLELDRAYVGKASPGHDLRLVAETVWVLVCVAAGRRWED